MSFSISDFSSTYVIIQIINLNFRFFLKNCISIHGEVKISLQDGFCISQQNKNKIGISRPDHNQLAFRVLRAKVLK